MYLILLLNNFIIKEYYIFNFNYFTKFFVLLYLHYARRQIFHKCIKICSLIKIEHCYCVYDYSTITNSDYYFEDCCINYAY